MSAAGTRPVWSNNQGRISPAAAVFGRCYMTGSYRRGRLDVSGQNASPLWRGLLKKITSLLD